MARAPNIGRWVPLTVWVAVAASASAAPGGLVAVTSMKLPAYAEAAAGLKSVVQAEVIDLDRTKLQPELLRLNPRLIVTIGSGALREVLSIKPSAAVLATLILDDGGAPAARLAGAVYLDVSLETVLSQLSGLFPGKTRLGLIRAGAENAGDADLERLAAERGFRLKVARCAGPEHLLPVFVALKPSCDLVWCAADGMLYNSVTIKPLILASLEYRLPIIGFSESFVRAGATAGIYPDFQDMGKQAGEMAADFLAGRNYTRQQQPRKVRLGVNSRVVRLMGLKPAMVGRDLAALE